MWITDPRTKLPSVTLTLGVFTLVLLVGVGFLNIYHKVDSVGPFESMFWSSCALYLGRRINIGGKSYSSDQANQAQQEIKDVISS